MPNLVSTLEAVFANRGYQDRDVQRMALIPFDNLRSVWYPRK